MHWLTNMEPDILLRPYVIGAPTWALGALAFLKERTSLLPSPLQTILFMMLNSTFLAAHGSRARLLGPREFGSSWMSLSGTVLCLQHQTGQLPQGLASGRTAARPVSASLCFRFVHGLPFSLSLLKTVSDALYVCSFFCTIKVLLSSRYATVIRNMMR